MREKLILLMVVAVMVMILGACQQSAPAPVEPEQAAAETAEPVTSKAPADRATVYVCDCGETCECGTVSAEPGSCQCQKPTRGYNLVQLNEGTAKLCSCGDGCDCGRINESDATQCGCGKPLIEVDLKGSGLYACACGPDCCRVVSNEPGLCDCDKPLEKL